MPDQASRDRGEPDRKNRQDDPDRDVPRHDVAEFTLDLYEVEAGVGEGGPDGHRSDRREDLDGTLGRWGQEPERRECEESLGACRQGGPEEGDPEGQVLNDDDRARDPTADDDAADDLHERENGHHREHGNGDGVLNPEMKAGPCGRLHGVSGGSWSVGGYWVARYSSRRRTTSSKMSAGQ